MFNRRPLRLTLAASAWTMLFLSGCAQQLSTDESYDLTDAGGEQSLARTEQAINLIPNPGALLATLAYTDAQVGIDRPGGDYKRMNTTNASACRSACVDDRRCDSFTYLPAVTSGSSAVCVLKEGVPAPRSAQGGIASGIVRQNGFEYAVDRPGSDYRNFDLTRPDPALCRTACESDQPKCRAFTYVHPGVQGPKARCWLKSTVPTARKNANVVSGIVLNFFGSVLPGTLPRLPPPPSPRTPELWEETWEALWLSEAAYWDGTYRPSRGDRDDPKRICMDKFGLTFDEYSSGREDAEVLVAHKGKKTLYIAMAGSESGDDWYTDVAVATASFKGVKVHQGFLLKANDAYPRLRAAWQEHLAGGGERNVTLVGHSLGGAMAQLMAVMFLDEFGAQGSSAPNLRVMTFGSPRVGAAAWVNKYESYPNLAQRTIRWVNKEDIIAHFPFDDDRWKHAGQRYQIYDKVDPGCDLKGFDSWGEYFDYYAEDPVCHPKSQLAVIYNAPNEAVSVLDTRFGWHSLMNGYRVSLRSLTAPAQADLAELDCSSDAAYYTPPGAMTCPRGTRCYRETPTDDCMCLEPGMDPP